MKSWADYFYGVVTGVAGLWGFAYWKMKATSVAVPAGTLVYSAATGATSALTAPTTSSALPIGSTFLLGGHEYSVQTNGTIQVT